MTFTYTDPVNNQRDGIRLLLGDTSQDQPLLLDEEIDYFISKLPERDDYYIASYCAEAISAKFTREVNLSADSQSLALDGLQQKYLALAQRLRALSQTAYPGTIYVGGVDPWVSEVQGTLPLAFGTQMHDNPEAGQQDYGDVYDRSPDYYEERARWVGSQ